MRHRATYNWKLFTNNAAADWYFEDFGYSEIGDADSIRYIRDVKAAGSNPLMTMVMLPWVAKSAEGSGNGHWSFSVAKYGAQCSTDPYNSDAGNGVKSDCITNLIADPNDANVPLLDQPGTKDPPGSVYRNQWAAALASAFGTAPHFYNMDNEMDIWGGTHRDVHPRPSAYDELRDTYLAEARALKGWDSKALRFGPVSCCWWFYWNGANNNDKGAHAGVDFVPWWLNEVYWQDKVNKTRSLDIFDIHAYPDGPDTSSWSQTQKQALSARIYRDYWDPSYVSQFELSGPEALPELRVSDTDVVAKAWLPMGLRRNKSLRTRFRPQIRPKSCRRPRRRGPPQRASLLTRRRCSC